MTTLVATSAQHEGAALVDGMSPVHLTLGMLAGLFGIDPHLAALTFVGARLVETAVREGTGHALFGREGGQSLGNEIVDIVFEMGGLHIGHYLRAQAQANSTAGLGAASDVFATAKVLDRCRLLTLEREVRSRFQRRPWFRGVAARRAPDGTYQIVLDVAPRTVQLVHAITHDTRDIAWKPYPIAIR